MSDFTIDARRLLCPMPVIRLQAAIAGAETGQTVEIVCTDPGTQSDIPAWCRVHQHSLDKHYIDGDDYWFVVTKQ